MPEGMLPPLILELRAKAGEVHSELKKVGSEVDEMAEKTEGGMSRSGKAFHGLAGAGKALTFGVAGAGLAIAAFGLEAVQTAQVADAKLETAVKNVGGSMEELEPQIKKTDSSMRGFGYTNAETNTAVATLTTSLGDPKKALADMSVVADLAREKNISLSESALLVAKAAEGQTRPLKALGIDLPVYAGGAQNVKLAQLALAKAQETVNAILRKTPDAVNPASKAHASYVKALEAAKAAQAKLTSTQHSGDAILAALTGRVKGNAEAYGKTLPGQIAMAKAQMDNMGEVVGNFLIPKLTQLLKAGNDVMHWMQQHKPVAEALAAVIGGVVVLAITAYVAGLVVAAATSIASFATMAAGWFGVGVAAEDAGAATTLALGPIGLAIAAVAIGAYELYKHWNTIWGGIKAVAVGAWHWAEDIFHNKFTQILIDLVAPGLFLATHWRQIWSDIQAAALGAWHFLDGDVLQPIEHGFQALVSFIGSVQTAFDKIFSTIFNGLINAGKSAFDWIANAWNETVGSLSFKIPDWVPGVGGDGFSMPQIPTFATGGSLNLSGFNIVGEYGPEVVGPRGRVITNRDSSKFLNAAMTPRAAAAAPASHGSGSQPIVLDVTLEMDGEVVARKVEKFSLQRGSRRGGAYQSNPKTS